MKILFFYCLLIGLAHGQETCMSESKSLCAMVDKNLDYHQKFHSALSEGFKKSLKNSDMKDFLKRNFRRHHGDLVVDTNFDRGGWFIWYKRILSKHDIGSCADLKKFGADDKLVLGCNEILNKVLSEKLPSDSNFRVKKIIVKVKNGIEAVYAHTDSESIVKRTLSSILDTPITSESLVSLSPKFIKVEEACRSNMPLLECMLYGQSNKNVLSVRGSVFLSDTTIEAIVAEAIASRVSRALHSKLEAKRFKLFGSLFYDKIEENRFEKIISKIQQLGSLNRSANTFIILRDYYSEQREFAPELLRLKAGYYCYEDKRLSAPTRQDQASHYSSTFDSLHRFDKALMLLCGESPLDSEPTAWNYSPDWADLSI